MKDVSILQQVFNDLFLVMVLFGAGGGLTAALLNGAAWKVVLRQVLIGALISGGIGTLSPYILSRWIEGIDGDLAASAGVLAGSAYLVGTFGTAVFEVVMHRIRKARGVEATND